jgi:hypothetical protein
MSREIVRSAIAVAMLSTFQPALAVSLNPNGIGEALIYPYYTVNKNQNTLISVVNPTSIGKAVQVRFREGYNGRDAMFFWVYLGPNDVWTASMSQTADDSSPVVKTSDKSCKGPLFPEDGVVLRSSGYDGTSPEYPADAGPQDLSRTREGSIEFIVGADIAHGSATEAEILGDSHHAPSCNNLASMSSDDLVAPTGGIYGSASIVNVGEGTFFAYNAVALQDFTDKKLFSANVPLGVTLADANSSESKRGGAVAYLTGSDERPLALDYANGYDAVSAVLTADSIAAEYFVDQALGANTDWVVTFPTKSYYVDKALYPSNPTTPFDDFFTAPGFSIVTVGGTTCDREQNCRTIATTPALPYQVNVLPLRTDAAFDEPSAVLGSNLTSYVIVPNDAAGNYTLAFGTSHQLTRGIAPDGTAIAIAGLPTLGFMAYNIVNANAQQGVLANYGGAFPLHAIPACEGPAGNCH